MFIIAHFSHSLKMIAGFFGTWSAGLERAYPVGQPEDFFFDSASKK